MPEAQLYGLTGLAYMRLADHRTATAYLQSAISGMSAYPRERTAWQIRLAQNLVQGGAIADGSQKDGQYVRDSIEAESE
ncbi:hypothetical protein IU449_22630 [Nocardia higoensis]|uniref:Tetratricopeptide repeat protein n=1 Tax=Nocardia higoensis TaxID=228599 RepID=A0ABS0DFP9_9NOCA|nr:hypothetical protein [Nocardia higoensis]MBF6357306.1 hypothetical protein [Nocardia higoensis]